MVMAMVPPVYLTVGTHFFTQTTFTRMDINCFEAADYRNISQHRLKKSEDVVWRFTVDFNVCIRTRFTAYSA